MALRKSRQDWIDAGMDLLRNQGQQALTIERLSQELGVTKGSFYHHFGNLANYRQALLEWWEDAFTHEPMRVACQEHDPSLRVQRLSRAVRDLDHPLEIALRAWGLRDPEVDRTVARVDSQRLECLTGLHRDQGHAQPELLAYLEYTAFVGTQLVQPAPAGAARALQQALELWRKHDT
ncbi:MAG: TetR/AcrR family transcriptional regulator [Candidatus Eremiobacteraeota bacterium]|nr:TetR/AcrR family transcriptional regulator [Candidatus Eremiobacteraeota bacterium]MCW5867361.1 TetR/AcrR family transcriptional regulator [Candidatus Eremiobacteraeota bacterium]